MKGKNKKKVRNYRNYYLIAIFVATLLMSVGYARVESVTRELSGNVSALRAKGIFIYDASINASSPANVYDSNISIMYGTMMQSTVVLNDNINSTLTMNITIYNKSEDDVYFDKTVYGDSFYDNNNIDFTLSGLTHGQLLAKNNSVTFTMTFKYTDAYKNTNPSTFTDTLNSYIGFEFKKGCSITYTNITGSGYTNFVLEGENLSVNFGSNAPNSIKVTGTSTSTEYVLNTDYTYSNGVLTFNNVTESLEVEGISSGGNVITDNTTTTYDHNTLTPGTTTVFNNIAGKPKVVVDDNGKVISFEYTDVGSGVSFTSGSSIDTGVDAFDSDGYTIHLKFKMNPSDNTGDMILSAMQKQNGNKYKGFSLNVYSRSSINIYANTNGANINNTAFGSLLNTFNISSGEQTFEFDMVYTPSPNKSISATLSPTTSGSHYTATSNHLSYYPDTLNDTSIVLGGNIANHNKDIEAMTVLEFSITKN